MHQISVFIHHWIRETELHWKLWLFMAFIFWSGIERKRKKDEEDQW